MQSWLRFEVDGRAVRVEGLSIRQTLAEYLDSHAVADLGFSGGDGDSFDQSVRPPANEPWQGGRLIGMLETEDGKPTSFRIIDASLMLLVQAADRSFVTAEGLSAEGADHPVIAALADHPLLDCDGDGLNNILLCLFEGWQRRCQGKSVGDEAQFLGEQLDACAGRSTDGARLRKVAEQLFRVDGAEKKEGGGFAKDGEVKVAKNFTASTAAGLPDLQVLDRAKRRFYRPQTVLEALKVQQQYADMRWVAGGTELGEQAYRGEADWPALIALDDISELKSVFDGGGDDVAEIEIGAAASLTQIAEHLGAEFPLLLKVLRRFGSRAVRNRATLGGHLAMASPTGDLWPVLMAMDASVRLASIDAERDVPVGSFYEAPGKTTLRRGELIRSIIVPRATTAGLEKRGVVRRLSDAYKVSRRRQLSRAILTAGFCIDLDAEGVVQHAVLAYSGVGDCPVRARETEKNLCGKTWDERTVIGALQALDKEIEVTRDDELAGRAYRRQVVITLFQKFFYQHAMPGDAGVVARDLGVISEILAKGGATG